MSLSIAQEQKYLGNEFWQWSVWIEGQDDDLNQIKEVTCRLPPSFPTPVRTVTDRTSKFKLEGEGWGLFTIRLDDARSLIRQLFRTEVDLVPDQQNKTLTVRLHPMSTEAHDEILRHICAEITATETVFPGTDLRLVYEIRLILIQGDLAI